MIVNRRDFLRRSIGAALGGVGLYSALGNLKVMAAAANLAKGGVFGDYKALVCVFLFGGNDSFNTVVPYTAPHYGVYQGSRPAMALGQSAVQAMALTPQVVDGTLPGGPPSDGASYGIHPSMPDLRALFNDQRAAIVANVGTLLGPISQAQYQSNPGVAPAQLFSHDDQANFWQTARADDANADGWGGRIADLLHAGNPNQQLPMTISLSGQSLFQRGAAIDQYVMSGNGVEDMSYLDVYQNQDGIAAFHALQADGVQAHMFERAYAAATRRAISTYQMVDAAVGAQVPLATVFPNTSLGSQLRQVARLIQARSALDMRRQVFFVGLGGFDTHDLQLPEHIRILTELSQGLSAFYQATEEMGVASQVTSFTASDFGRTVSTNGDGTDHGWGGHHFVLGGAVRGGRFFGTLPSLAQNGNPDDAGYGQIIPTTGVDQYAATLATWFGVDSGDFDTLFPRLGEFDTPNLGFMTS
jgi:uncharacterized protein (DUF1501 family)